ncbi:MAG: hypothetical protein HFJ75_00230 [Eggerthellaceae bacterium]|nr:hypothetical protein [Eggerthellaceae bacterium]
MVMKIREFLIEASDCEKLDAFEVAHAKCQDKHPDVCGSLLSYTFIPAGIGMAVTVERSCGEKLYLSGGMS